MDFCTYASQHIRKEQWCTTGETTAHPGRFPAQFAHPHHQGLIAEPSAGGQHPARLGLPLSAASWQLPALLGIARTACSADPSRYAELTHSCPLHHCVGVHVLNKQTSNIWSQSLGSAAHPSVASGAKQSDLYMTVLICNRLGQAACRPLLYMYGKYCHAHLHSWLQTGGSTIYIQACVRHEFHCCSSHTTHMHRLGSG